MPLLKITGTGGLSLQVYAGGVAKPDIEPLNVGQQEIDKTTQYNWEIPCWASLIGPHSKCGPVIPNYCGEHVSSGKLKGPMPAVKSNSSLND